MADVGHCCACVVCGDQNPEAAQKSFALAHVFLSRFCYCDASEALLSVCPVCDGLLVTSEQHLAAFVGSILLLRRRSRTSPPCMEQFDSFEFPENPEAIVSDIRDAFMDEVSALLSGEESEHDEHATIVGDQVSLVYHEPEKEVTVAVAFDERTNDVQGEPLHVQYLSEKSQESSPLEETDFSREEIPTPAVDAGPSFEDIGSDDPLKLYDTLVAPAEPFTEAVNTGDACQPKRKKRKKKSKDEDEAKKSHTCPRCGEAFTQDEFDDGTYNFHVEHHDAPREQRRFKGWLKCPECTYQTKRHDCWRKHVQRRHGPGIEKKFKCDLCEERFPEYTAKRTHMYKVHYKKFPFLCSRCGKGFYTKAGLRFHADGGCQDGVAPTVICEVCGKEVKSRAYKKHLKVIHDQKRLECPYCDVTMVKRESMQNHIAKFHGVGDPVKRPKAAANVCKHCGKQISDKAFYVAHVFMEHGERLPGLKEFACAYCPKVFHTKANFDAHVLNHTGVRRFVCRVCGYKTNYSGNLNLHVRRVHKDVDYASLPEWSGEDQIVGRAIEHCSDKLERGVPGLVTMGDAVSGSVGSAGEGVLMSAGQSSDVVESQGLDYGLQDFAFDGVANVKSFD